MVWGGALICWETVSYFIYELTKPIGSNYCSLLTNVQDQVTCYISLQERYFREILVRKIRHFRERFPKILERKSPYTSIPCNQLSYYVKLPNFLLLLRHKIFYCILQIFCHDI
jgi:hypothetical protein